MASHRPQPVEQAPTRAEEEALTFTWVPYESYGGTLRISRTSCCGAVELACEGGEYFVLRYSGVGRYEETSRGVYLKATAAYATLEDKHRREHHPLLPGAQ